MAAEYRRNKVMKAMNRVATDSKVHGEVIDEQTEGKEKNERMARILKGEAADDKSDMMSPPALLTFKKHWRP